MKPVLKKKENADLKITGDAELNQAIRFNIFHLMSTGNEHDEHVNVGAKLLTGEEYGGHAFWDTELFMLPFFAWVFPKTAQNLENYRYHLLDAARANAHKNGYKGAQYPWESADDGTEQCPDWTIEPDGTCYRCYVAVYEHHVTAAVAYGICNYIKITQDMEFLYSKGAEILTETARFWASRCEYNQAQDRYEINQVTGPDEWHEPVNNNLYTNYLARWNLRYVLSLLTAMKEEKADAYRALVEKTGLTECEMETWREVQEKIYLPRKEGTKLLEQFEGYFELDNVTIEQYDENDWPVRPEALKTKKASETQITKQADVVMLLHLLGEEFDEETIHAANTGGVWQTVVFGFAGVSQREDGMLKVRPNMPKEWQNLTFRLHYRGAWLEITVDGANQAEIKRLAGEAVEVEVNGVVKEI